MSVNYQTIEVPFGVGVSEDVAEYARSAPQIAALVNARITKTGSITPRDGYTALGDAFNAPARVNALKDQLYVVETLGGTSTNNVRAYLKGLQTRSSTPVWATQGGGAAANALSEAVILERRPIARDEWAQDDPDVAVDTTNRWVGVCWKQQRERGSGFAAATRVFAMVFDLDTWAVVAPVQEISTGAAAGSECYAPRIIRSTASGVAAFLVVYAEVGTGKIRGRMWSGGAWGTDTTLVTDHEAGGLLWDVACETNVSSGDTATGLWYLAYKDTTPRINLVKFTELTSTTTANIAETPACIGISQNTADGHLWVSWYVTATTNLRTACLNSTTLASVLAATTVAALTNPAWNIGSCRLSANKILVCWTEGGLAAVRQRAGFKTLTSAGALGTACTRYSIGYLSKPWLSDATVYAVMHYDGNSSNNGSAPGSRDSDGNSTAFTVALTDTGDASNATPRYSFRSVATWMIGFAGHRRAISDLGHLRITSTTAYKFCFAATAELRQVVEAVGSPTVGVNGVDLCRFSLDSSVTAGKPDRWKAVEFSGCRVFPGGQTMLFDGSHVSEYGFFWPPENASMAAAGGGSGDLLAGNYGLQAIWEYSLANGDVLRSAPALVRNASTNTYTTTVATDKLNIVQQPLNLTQKYNAATGGGTEELKSAPLVRYYRTEANGGIYYLDVPSVPTVGTLANDIFADNSTALTTTLGRTAVSGLADTTLIARAELYTTGGILPNYPFPASDHLCVHRNRLYGISSEDKKTILFTHVKQEGEMPCWHPFLTLRLEDGGDCVALASMDDKLIVFKESSIWVIYGNGPDRMGVNSDHQIQKIPVDYGCEDRRSIANIPAGIMFRANRGICLLDRKLQVEFVGGPVMDEVDENHETRAAVTLPQTQRVYFLNSSLTVSNLGSILVYHWDSNQWSIDSVTDGERTSGIDAINVANQFYLLGPNSYLNKETGGVDPNGSVYAMAIQTAWIPVGSTKQGHGRCRFVTVLGKKLTNYAAIIVLAQDRGSATQTVTLSASDINAMSGYQPKVHVSQQRCQSLALAIQVTGSTDSRCVELTGLALDIGMKQGIARLPDANMRG